MGVGSKLTNEVKSIATLVIIIVVMSIVLLRFKTIEGVTSGLNTAIDNTVLALDEPVTWVSIIVIIIVVAWLMAYLNKKKGGM